MPTDAAFRLSTYLTLALSCACVGYAESDLLPEVVFIAGGVVLALAILFRLESRIELLSIPAANRLGVLLGLGYFGWAALRLNREAHQSGFENSAWQLFLVALVGPLLITLMPAKLARRERHAGDYWGLQVMGLGGAALAGAMAEDLVCFVLIGLYATCALWSLTVFHLRQASGAVASMAGKKSPSPVVAVVSRGKTRSGVTWAIGFAIVAVVVAGPLYLLTPRSSADKFSFGKPRVEIGYAADQMTDLNQTGDLKANELVAFEVMAAVDGHPKTDLSHEQRWRGRTLRRYVNGSWRTGETRLPTIEPSTRNTVPWTIPQLGPGQFTLTFAVPGRLRSQFLADPVVWVSEEPAPVATLTRAGRRGWLWVGDGSFLWSIPQSTGEPLQYVQAWRAGEDPDLGSPFHLVESDVEEILRPLRNNPVPKVKEYADAVLDGMIRDGKLPPDCRDRVRLLPRLEFHDRIARAFSAHLASSPDLTYTTNLRREQRNVDPIEEFLFHVKAGHCERFASALTLMLRSQGIPAVMVLGFKGCEPTAEPGKYVVREEHAHAWVEALIQVFETPTKPGLRPVSRWRSLDPTPVAPSAPDDAPGPGWIHKTGSRLRTWYREYVADYTAEQRRHALAELARRVIRTETLIGAAIAVSFVILVRATLRRRRTRITPSTTSTARWFDRLLALLAGVGFTSAPGETPREFATRVAEFLRNSMATVAVAEVPLDCVEAYYESRFGRTPLTPYRQTTLETRLEELARALMG